MPARSSPTPLVAPVTMKIFPAWSASSLSVKEAGDQIIFLRKVVPGAADKSYGIQVAKLAGIPRTIIDRAREILNTLERKERAMVEETKHALSEANGSRTPVKQMSLFDSRERDVIDALRVLQPDAMTPIQALNALEQLKEKLEK